MQWVIQCGRSIRLWLGPILILPFSFDIRRVCVNSSLLETHIKHSHPAAETYFKPSWNSSCISRPLALGLFCENFPDLTSRLNQSTRFTVNNSRDTVELKLASALASTTP